METTDTREQQTAAALGCGQIVTTRTGTDAHWGTAGAGYIQTLCGIGYGRRAAGRAVTGHETTCERCLAMVERRSDA